MESGQSAGGGYQAGVPDFNSREFKVLSESEILAYFLNSAKGRFTMTSNLPSSV